QIGKVVKIWGRMKLKEVLAQGCIHARTTARSDHLFPLLTGPVQMLHMLSVGQSLQRLLSASRLAVHSNRCGREGAVLPYSPYS
ncbi:hypothetical protein ILYODFUR_027989, partial [Ilyodon furcidens]